MSARSEDISRANSDASRRPARGTTAHLANLLAIAIAVAFVGLAAAYGIDAMGRAQQQNGNAAKTSVVANVSGVSLSIPASALRFPEQQASTFSDRIDLAFTLSLESGATLPLRISLVPKSRARASSVLLDTVYLQHFTSKEQHGVPGLIGKPLTDAEGYRQETVWYDPIHQDPFTAKCSSPIDEAGADACLRTIALDSGLSAVVGFPENGLAYWRKFDPALTALFETIGAGRIER